jgi:serine/threonine protein kinase
VLLFILLMGYPPYKDPVVSDWYFNALRCGRKDLFWQAHDRFKVLPPQAKGTSLGHPQFWAAVKAACVLRSDLLSKMLTVQPKDRITVEGVLAHHWTGTASATCT